MNREQNQSQDTETRILRAAEKEFFSKGYAGARTASIAEAAGVTHAMLHYYFRTKDKLFERIVSEKINILADIILSAIGDGNLPLVVQVVGPSAGNARRVSSFFQVEGAGDVVAGIAVGAGQVEADGDGHAVAQLGDVGQSGNEAGNAHLQGRVAGDGGGIDNNNSVFSQLCGNHGWGAGGGSGRCRFGAAGH